MRSEVSDDQLQGGLAVLRGPVNEVTEAMMDHLSKPQLADSRSSQLAMLVHLPYLSAVHVQRCEPTSVAAAGVEAFQVA